MTSPPPLVSFLVACYDEEENITATLETLRQAIARTGVSAEILVADDASTDQSVARVSEWQAAHPQCSLRLLTNKVNQGLAVNYAEGAFLGTGEYYRLVCGDNVEPVETLEKVIHCIGLADVVIFHQPDLAGRPWPRRLLSRSYTALINLLSGNRLAYYNGLPLIRRQLVMRWHSDSHGFGFQADLITRLLDRGASHVEIPVIAINREHGHSKALTLRNLLSVGHTLLSISIRRTAKLLYGHN